MTRHPPASAFLIAAAILAASCDSRSTPDSPRAPSPISGPTPTTLTVAGLVKDETGAPIAQARVEIFSAGTVRSPYGTTTTDTGAYALTIPWLNRPELLWATLDGYEPNLQELQPVTARAPLDFRLTRPIRVVEGASVDVALGPADTICPDDFADFRSRCRFLRFTPPRAGTLLVHVAPSQSPWRLQVSADDGGAIVCCASPLALNVVSGREVTITLRVPSPPVPSYAVTVAVVIETS